MDVAGCRGDWSQWPIEGKHNTRAKYRCRLVPATCVVVGREIYFCYLDVMSQITPYCVCLYRRAANLVWFAKTEHLASWILLLFVHEICTKFADIVSVEMRANERWIRRTAFQWYAAFQGCIVHVLPGRCSLSFRSEYYWQSWRLCVS